MNSSFSSNHPGAIHAILQIVLVQNSYHGKELNTFCPPNSSDDIYIFFCLHPSSMALSFQGHKWPPYFTVRAEQAADLQRLQENHQREIHKALTKSKVGRTLSI